MDTVMDEYEPNDATSNWAPATPMQRIEPPPICLGEISPPPQQQQQQAAGHGVASHGEQPVKVRKKPGRKPNPASPALRKAQNRAAQRAFRERKERHLRDLETTIKALREKHHAATKELQTTQAMLDSFRVENWYLKGVVLTLQFVCMHHHIHIPTHSPYLSEEALNDMAHSSPHAIEAYVNAYTLNNVNLKPAMASHFAHNAASTSTSTSHNDEERHPGAQQGPATPSPSPPSISESISIKHEDEDEEPDSQQQQQQQPLVVTPENSWQQQHPVMDERPSLSAIQRLRLQLRCQSRVVAPQCPKSAARLQPTLLQLAIPHDSRIDLIPAPHMRDRMIIFRDQMDYDRCFSLLLNGAVQHGDDPTLAHNWELPPEFFSEFWYLTIDYDMKRTNKWRRAKGLPDISTTQSLQQQQQQQHHHATWPPPPSQPATQQPHSDDRTHDHAWTDEMLSQIVEGMPSLQPMDHHDKPSYLHYPDMVISASPEDYHSQLRSPSVSGMMDLMAALSTTEPTL